MPNDNLAFGIDLSRYNTSADGKVKVDFDIIAAHQPEVAFIAVGAGVSWGYRTPWFLRIIWQKRNASSRCVWLITCYCRGTRGAQMDNFFSHFR